MNVENSGQKLNLDDNLCVHMCSNALVWYMQFLMKKSLLPAKNLSSSERKMFGKEELEKLLEQHFGYSGFRGKQLEAIQAVLSGLISHACLCKDS